MPEKPPLKFNDPSLERFFKNKLPPGLRTWKGGLLALGIFTASFGVMIDGIRRSLGGDGLSFTYDQTTGEQSVEFTDQYWTGLGETGGSLVPPVLLLWWARNQKKKSPKNQDPQP